LAALGAFQAAMVLVWTGGVSGLHAGRGHFVHFDGDFSCISFISFWSKRPDRLNGPGEFLSLGGIQSPVNRPWTGGVVLT
jgi:hypothetical protein